MNNKFQGSKSEIKKLLALYGLKSKSIVPIKDGIINSSFFVLDSESEEYVLRVYQRGTRADRDILNELRITAKFRQAGVPIPQTLKNVKGQILTKFRDSKYNQWRAIVMEFITGHHLKSNEHSLISEFAGFQAQMHELGQQILPRPNLKSSFNKMAVWLKEERTKALLKKLPDSGLKQKYEGIVQDILLEIKEREKEIWTLPAGYVHLDYDSNNIIVSDRHIRGILDFDDLSYQPLALDSAFSLWWWLFFNPILTHTQILRRYRQGYTKRRHWSTMESQLLPLFIRLRNATLAALLFINLPKGPDLKSLKKAIKLDSLFKTLKL